MQINQFHSGTTVGDAITNMMLELQELLTARGYESEIYAEYIDERLSGKIKPIEEYKGNNRKALIYHNITPEHFFEDEGLKKAIRKGLWQAKEYRKYVEYSIADSNYNRKELLGMGYENVDVMPIQISLDRFDHVLSEASVLEDHEKYKNIIFVGRVVPNKCQKDILHAFAVYNNFYNVDSRLFIVGDDGMEGYVNELKEISRDYAMEDKVFFTGKVSEEELKAYYEMADLFLCMSEHEGFGVPLLEAMKMGVPVISYRSSAIPETMNGAGVLVNEKNYA